MFSLACIITMAACIFLVGIFYSIVNNVNSIAHKVEEEVPITVFFDEGTTEEEIQAVGAAIQARPEVARMDYQSADQAWEDYKQKYLEMKMQQMDSRMTILWPILPTIRYILMISPNRQSW